MRPNTKMLDDTARKSLIAYSSDTGVVRFSQSTSLLQNLAPGDILLSLPAPPAAPYGMLRKVTAVHQQGAAVTVETRQAKLSEAFSEVKFTVKTTLSHAAIASVTPLQKGVSLGTSNVTPQQISVSDSTISIQDLEIPDGYGDILTVNGQINYDGPGVQLDAFIDWPCLTCGPHGHFDASFGLHEQVNLQAKGSGVRTFHQEVPLYTVVFDPIIIGPVVIVPNLVFKLVVDASANGEITFHFSGSLDMGPNYHWENSLDNLSGTWRDDSGWSGPQLDAGVDDFKLDAHGQLAMAASFDLLIYDVVGPFVDMDPSVAADVKLPAHPAWQINGHITMNAGVKVTLFDIIGDLDWHDTLIDTGFHIADAPNYPPTIKITQPADGYTTPATLGPVSVDFSADASDPQDGTPSVSWSSNVDGPLGQGVSINYDFSSAKEGDRRITATATDSLGLTASDAITIHVVFAHVPPQPEIQWPQNGKSYLMGTYELVGRAKANEPGNLGWMACDHLVWSSTVPSDAIGKSVPQDPNSWSGTGWCQTSATFTEVGERTIQLKATNRLGDTGTATATMTVTQPPPGLTVLIQKPQPHDSFTIYLGSSTSITLQGNEIVGGAGLALVNILAAALPIINLHLPQYAWYWYPTGGNVSSKQLIVSGTLVNGTTNTWQPQTPVCQQLGTHNVTVRLEVSDPSYGAAFAEVPITIDCEVLH
jgi:hypothetical protein